jgi:hypothetical protein
MPIYQNALTQRPANMLAYQDSMSATPRNEYLGALADLIAQSYSPERTQQMQGISRFLSAPEISQTLDRLSYGEPLTTGAGMTTRIRPEAAEAALALAPSAKPVTMATLQAARAARQAALAGGMAGERYAERVVPGIMERGGLPAELALDLTQGSRSRIFAPAKALPAKREYVEPSTPTDSIMQVGGREVPVTMYPLEAKQGNKIVNVDPAAFDAQFSKNENFYVGKGGEGGIGNRYDKFVDWIKDAPSMNASNVSVSSNGSVMFGNGRHRYAGLRDLGVSSIPVSMDAKSIANAKKFGLLAK